MCIYICVCLRVCVYVYVRVCACEHVCRRYLKSLTKHKDGHESEMLQMHVQI